MNAKVYRILDANFNRAKEGLRVCEDICRFVYDKRAATRSLKDVRHELNAVMTALQWKEGVNARDVGSDVGRASTLMEMKRRTAGDVLFANLQRAKESVRVLEEMLKVVKNGRAEKAKGIRYRIYQIERDLIQKI